ncbi:hypothetical protein B0H13DRAFT_1856344 [Mycena leptocephala]|nr:hypothetical protein B0H13DRAFT_1856344 [Mycena leptocephala]
MQLAETKSRVTIFQNKRVSVVAVWEQLLTEDNNGRNGLVKLAILLLSIVTNSAGSERGFSKFGIFLTKLRSQLSIQKVRKMNIVDMELKRNHEELGLTTDREGGGMPGYDEADSFAGLSTQLIQDLADSTPNGDSDDEDGDDEADGHGDDEIVHSPANYTLKQLFEYPTNAATSLENGLGFHWQYGVKDLQEELDFDGR